MREITEHRVSGHAPNVREVAKGLLVRQGPDAYIARSWRLTPAAQELIDVAAEAGL